MPAENERERKNSIGSIGARALRSHAMKAASSADPSTSAETTSALPQPTEFPRTRPQTIPSAPTLTRPRPRMSSAVSGPKLSGILRKMNGIASRPIGTFSQKIHSQLIPCTTAPPTSGPLATASPVIALKIPIAAPRFSGGKAAVSSASASGVKSAAPAP